MKNNFPLISKKIKPFFLAFSAVLFFSSCAALMGGMMGDMGGATEPEVFDFEYEEHGEINFTILQMNDVYEIAPLEKGKVGGMARVATVRNQQLEENFNVFTVLAGDFLYPSLLGTLKYEGEGIKGRQMVEVMNEVGVDLVAYGNHEFDIKEKELQQRMDESYFDWIGTNVLHRNGKKLEPFHKESYGIKYFSPETFLWEVTDYMSGNTITVGFYSATINSNQKDYVYYEDPFQEATKAYLSLKNEADIILGLTHLSIEQDLKMASLLPGTALIMGGHEHENSLDTVGNVVIAKADANAKTVYLHHFTYYPATKETVVASELVPITDAIADDPSVAEIVERWQQVQHDVIAEVVSNPNEIIFTAKEPLDGREVSVRNVQTNLGALVGAAMAHAAKKQVDCAFFNGGSIRLDDWLSGDITPVDFFRALPYGGKIYEVDVKGNILKKTLNAGLENAGQGGYLQWHNISFDEKNKTWFINGKKLNERKVYHIVTNEYLANGKERGLEFFNPKNFVKWETAKNGDPDDPRSDIRKAIVEFLSF